MNLKLSAHWWSSKNSLLNKLLDTSAKEKKIIPVCAIYSGLNFVAIDGKISALLDHSGITQT